MNKFKDTPMEFEPGLKPEDVIAESPAGHAKRMGEASRVYDLPNGDDTLTLETIDTETDQKKQEEEKLIWIGEGFEPGRYEIDLSNGKRLEIPSSFYITIKLGKMNRELSIAGNILSLEKTNEKSPQFADGVARLLPNPSDSFEIKEGESIIIGRNTATELGFDIPDKGTSLSVSREHLRFSLKNGIYLIEDLNSTHGTHINFTIKRPKVEIPKEEPLPKINL